MKRGFWFSICAALVLGLGLACGGEQEGSDLPNNWEAHKDKMKRAAAKAKKAAAKAKKKAKTKGKAKGKGKKKR